jgi:hypothetical protein
MFARFSTVALAGLLLAAGARAQPVEEYQVKAAFLYNFVKFVEWPAEAFKTPGDPVTICVLGRNPFGGALEEAVQGKVVAGRSFAVRELSEAVPQGECQVVFVAVSERKRFHSILKKLKSPGILTVGEASGFAAEGGVINFRLENGRVRFEINVDAADEKRLKVSSKLLALAEIIRSGKK